jgi:hypothetical protein
MQAFPASEGWKIQAVDNCRLLPIILREYREFGRTRPERFLPVEHFEDI